MLSTKQIIHLLNEYGYMGLSDSDGACACGAFSIGGIHVRTHCHRTGRCCPFSGVHIWKDIDSMFKDKELKEIGDWIAKRLSKDYMTDTKVRLTTEEKERKLGY